MARPSKCTFRTIARVLFDVSGRDFASAAHLAAYAGLAPVTSPVGNIDSRGPRIGVWQPKAEASVLLVGVRLAARSDIARVQRP